mgnify:CR=1 FL=1
MNNIYNTANKLAKEIQESSEYKNYKKAINYFNKGFQVHPSFSGFLVNLGLIYFDLKDYEKAIVYYCWADGGRKVSAGGRACQKVQLGRGSGIY